MKKYDLDFKEEEYKKRLAIFSKNHIYIFNHNRRNNITYELGHNESSHLDKEEVLKAYTGLITDN